MRLDFRTSEDEESFSWKRLLLRVGAGIGVFLVFVLIGHYIVAPMLVHQPQSPVSSPSQNDSTKPSLPKVEVYEKLPSDVVAGTGAIMSSQEVAPYDYEEFQRKRKAQVPAKPTPPTEEEPLIQVPEETSPTETPESMPFTPEEPIPDTPPASDTSEPPSEPTEPLSAWLYRVQVGVYENRENANQVLQSLNASGFEATIVPFQRDGYTLYRVQTLVTREREKAEQAKKELEAQGFPAVIVPVR